MSWLRQSLYCWTKAESGAAIIPLTWREQQTGEQAGPRILPGSRIKNPGSSWNEYGKKPVPVGCIYWWTVYQLATTDQYNSLRKMEIQITSRDFIIRRCKPFTESQQWQWLIGLKRTMYRLNRTQLNSTQLHSFLGIVCRTVYLFACVCLAAFMRNKI